MHNASSPQTFWLRGAALAACCAVCICLASCGLPTISATPSNIQAGDKQNGATITLHRGQTLIVTLASTYWSFQGSSNHQALVPVGDPVVAPAPFYQHTVPGSGAGSVSQTFRAVGPGTAQVTASRTSCGEAMACGGGADGRYQLTVQVAASSP